jgi:Protein of unknown function (DUF2442)
MGKSNAASFDHWSDEQFATAKAAGEEAMRSQPRAVAARYDAKSGRIVIDLATGATFAFPADLAQGLAGQSAADLSDIEISPAGFGLCWGKLDVDYTVAGLMNGIFGTRAYMARMGGLAKSSAKAAAARANGKKGGRPRKVA